MTLLIMAGGLGSRYKDGIKQMQKVNGKIIMEYSIIDAIKAGFNKIVIVIRKDIEKDLKEILNKYDIEIKYVIQENIYRIKPLGTGYAVLITKKYINEPFLVINADDYYGPKIYKKMYEYLNNNNTFCMAGFKLKNTISENGTVNRGICITQNNYLININETLNIKLLNNKIIKDNIILDKNSIVSMNMWGFNPKIYEYLEKEFDNFVKELDDKNEFMLPKIVNDLLKKEKVYVIETDDKWLGITYKEDLETVEESLSKIADMYN